jgi:Lar family restriction alleviation protein
MRLHQKILRACGYRKYNTNDFRTPCPFCGSTKIGFRIKDYMMWTTKMYRVTASCYDCKSNGPETDNVDKEEAKKEALKRWDVR